MYDIDYMPAAEKYFRKIKDKTLKKKYEEAIYDIRQDPGIGEPKRGDLYGIYGYNIYYNKTNYEIAYSLIEDENSEVVIIVMAGTRENFYDALKNYIKVVKL